MESVVHSVMHAESELKSAQPQTADDAGSTDSHGC